MVPKKLRYIRVDDEAIDLRLKWSPEDESLIDQSHFFINPSMLFLDDGHGGYEWVRSVRLHSMEASVNGQTSYHGSPLVQERAHMYKSHILLGSEPFRGDLSGGFDFESVSKWGFDTGSPLPVVDSHLYTNEAVGKVNWESDLCETKPDLYLEKGHLVRKQVKGPEDPKLVRLPVDANSDQQNSWGLSFSSFPPAPSGETLENCKWHEESVVRMYVAPNGPNLALGQDVSANRLDYGHHAEDEKNWIALPNENELHYIYMVEPHVVVKAHAADAACEQVYNTTSEQLQDLASHISVRGSATAVRYSDSEYVALLHTKEKSTSEGGYTTRAYKFEARPPFRVIQVSKPFLAN